MKKYNFTTCGRSKKEAVICGDGYRITALTSSLLRLEYSESGDFEDRATQSVINRDFPVPAFSVERNAGGIVVEHYSLIFQTGFPMKGTDVLFFCTERGYIPSSF